LFTINNSIFSADPNDKSKHKENNVLYQQSMETLKRLLDFAYTLKIRHTEAFSELKQKRDTFMNDLCLVLKKITALTKHIDVNKAVKSDIDKMTTDEILNLDKSKYVVSYYVEKPTTYYNTRCIRCFSNCHEECVLEQM
jgi:hypothetical protein